MSITTEADMILYLLAHGWERNTARAGWQWSERKFPGAAYRLRDAFDIAKSEEGSRARRKSSNTTKSY